MSATVNTLAHVFSEVLVATTDEAREGMRESCFSYLLQWWIPNIRNDGYSWWHEPSSP